MLPIDATGQTAFSQKQEVYLESGFCLGGYSAFSERILKPENMGGWGGVRSSLGCLQDSSSDSYALSTLRKLSHKVHR